MGMMVLNFMACNGGGNGDGSPAGARFEELNHNELVDVFVRELNMDIDFNVTVAQSSTFEENFVVIFDPTTDTFDAINLDNFNPNVNNAVDYYFDNLSRAFLDLDFIPERVEFRDTLLADGSIRTERIVFRERYRDRNSGLVFEKIKTNTKDLAKIVALTEAAKVQKSAQFLSSSFGLSLERGKEIATLQAHWKKSSKKAMTNAEVDAFTTELLGFSLTTGIDAYKAKLEGDASSLNTLLGQSAEVNNITPEHASQIMTKVFGL